MLKWTTAGESHGQALIAIVEGMVADLSLTTNDISEQLARRRLGFGRGARMSFEKDVVTLLGGVRHGKTLGGPIAIQIANSEWPKWTEIMSSDPVEEENISDLARNAPLTRPRPGHADFAGMIKYGATDARNILERSSARETAARVAAGTVAREFLSQALDVDVVSRVLSIGDSERWGDDVLPTREDCQRIDASPVRASDTRAEESMIECITQAKKAGDTLGGVIEVVVHGLPIGIGSFVSGEDRLESHLASAVMSIPAIKGVEVGEGFANATRRGSEVHDQIYRSEDQGVHRTSNRAGGVEGGMTNGQPLVVRAAMKPISTVPRALSTIDMQSGESATALHQRSDVCAVPAAAVVAEAMVALVVARAVLAKFGGDTLTEVQQRYREYTQYVEERLTW